jgi:hypothetical protein
MVFESTYYKIFSTANPSLGTTSDLGKNNSEKPVLPPLYPMEKNTVLIAAGLTFNRTFGFKT